MSEALLFPETPYGKFLGIVARTDDPEKRGRVQVYVDQLLGANISPWIEPSSLGMDVPDTGANVWVEVAYSDDHTLWQLIYLPGAQEAEALPPTAQGVDDESSGALKAGQPMQVPPATAKASSGWPTTRSLETVDALAPSPNAGVYPRNNVRKTKGGFILETDDTPYNERLAFWHPSGAYFEVNAQGGLCHRFTNLKLSVVAGRTTQVGGDELLEIQGARREQVTGNDISFVDGDTHKRTAGYDLAVDRNMQVQVAGGLTTDVDGLAEYNFTNNREVSVGGLDSYANLGGYNASYFSNFNLLLALGGTFVLTPGTTLDIKSLPAPTVPVATSAITLATSAFVTSLNAVATALETTNPVAATALFAAIEVYTGVLTLAGGGISTNLKVN